MNRGITEEEAAMLLAQARDSVLDRQLALPENKAIKEEWDAIQLLRAKVDHAMILSFTSTDYREVVENGLFVSSNFAHLAHRTFAIKPLIHRLLMSAPHPMTFITRPGGNEG